MKQVKITMPRRAVTLACGLALAATAFGQQVVVKGHVVDATGEPVIGATVRIDGQQGGTVTDIDGNFTLNANSGATVTVDYIGYESYKGTASSNMSITLQEGKENALNEVVVIGYGAVKKSDLTGSVTALKPDSKNKGLVVNAQEMISGKIAGVNVTTEGGAPGSKATIRIRGGASLNADSDPLIVIDGIPMDNNGVKGLSNALSIVNPQDIESFNILKDASATAIYGSRGSNGVIIITTKKGRKGQKVQIGYNGSATVSMKRKTIDVMDGDQYRNFVTNLYKGTSQEQTVQNALGKENTDWQEEIYRTAITQDHALTLSGSLGTVLPYRVSVGYTGEQGILKTSDFDRYTASVNLNPSLLNDHLKFNINVKGMYADTKYANTDAISAAVWMDPTKPVRSSDAMYSNFGGYYEWTQPGTPLGDKNWAYTYNNNATKNPVALLNLKNDRAHSKDLNANLDVDYQIQGFEDLRLHGTVGYDIAEGKQLTDVDPASPENIYYGSHGWEKILKRNFTASAYAQYYHDFNDPAKNHFDIMLGSEFQRFWRSQHNNYYGYYGAGYNDASKAGTKYNDKTYDFITHSKLLSFFGRANWTLMDSRYMLTATVRADGSSRFNWLQPYDNKQWGVFPSFAFGWRIKDENKFRDISWLSDLKLRLGYGTTGQQNLGTDIGDYPYYDTYDLNVNPTSYYDIDGDGSLARPVATNHTLTWEKTTTYNIGLDWGILNQRISGSIDWYYRKTTDLISTVNVGAGSTFKNTLPKNVGDMTNTGVEAAIHFNPIQTKDWNWMIDYNFTYNQNNISRLTEAYVKDYFIPVGGISAGTGNNCQAHAVGHPAFSYYVFQQAYGADGKPLEGVVVDRNGDGVITEKDKYFYKSPVAPVTMGLSSRLEYKSWDLGFSLRASIGNYVFNNLEAGSANVGSAAIYRNEFLSNRPISALAAGWTSDETYSVLSDRYVQNGSFLKCDNITLGYSFNSLFRAGKWAGLNGRIYGAVNNVFTITKYSGIDPEVYGGIDNNVYPRPFSAMVGLNLNF